MSAAAIWVWVFLTKTAKCQLAVLVKNTQERNMAKRNKRNYLGINNRFYYINQLVKRV